MAAAGKWEQLQARGCERHSAHLSTGEQCCHRQLQAGSLGAWAGLESKVESLAFDGPGLGVDGVECGWMGTSASRTCVCECVCV